MTYILTAAIYSITKAGFKDVCMDRLILRSKRDRASPEEGTDEVGVAAKAAHGPSDGLAEDS